MSMSKSGIPYLTHSWSPVTGCTPVSAGCAHCWAARNARRWKQDWSVRVHPERLSQPGMRGPNSVIGVCFNGDLFHDEVPDGFVLAVLERAMKAPWHQYLLLTKRAERMAEMAERLFGRHGCGAFAHVWWGVTVESWWQIGRLGSLYGIAKMGGRTWVSLEPMIEYIDPLAVLMAAGRRMEWVVLGGESGPGARVMPAGMPGMMLRVCAKEGVPFWFKQWGSNVSDAAADQGADRALRDGGCVLAGLQRHDAPDEILRVLRRVGKGTEGPGGERDQREQEGKGTKGT